MTPDIDLDALSELLEPVEAAPWVAEYDAIDNMWLVHSNAMDIAKVHEKDDALLFCGARNQLPALLSALTAARDERDEARAAVLELGDAIIRANGWEPQSGVTVELSSALERLVVQRDLLRENRDQSRAESDRLRAELETARTFGADVAKQRNAAREALAEAVESERSVREQSDTVLSAVVSHREEIRAERDALRVEVRAFRGVFRDVADLCRDVAANTAEPNEYLVGVFATQVLSLLTADAVPAAAPQDDDYRALLADTLLLDAKNVILKATRAQCSDDPWRNDASRWVQQYATFAGDEDAVPKTWPDGCVGPHTCIGECALAPLTVPPGPGHSAAPQADPYPLVPQDFRDAVAKTAAERWPDKYGAAAVPGDGEQACPECGACDDESCRTPGGQRRWDHHVRARMDGDGEQAATTPAGGP